MEAARPRVSQDVLLLAIKGPMAQRISRSVLTDQRIYENERQASRLGSYGGAPIEKAQKLKLSVALGGRFLLETCIYHPQKHLF